MNRRSFLTHIASLPAVAGQQIQVSRRPRNIVVIVTDDHGVGDVGCYGYSKDALTPNIDALAASGVRFAQFYSNAPVCSASRAAILTGKYPARTGVAGALRSEPTWDVPGLRAGEQTLASLLRNRGYRTAAIGKWHLGSAPQSRPRSQGFDQFFGWYSGWVDYYSHRYYQLGFPPGKIFHDLWRNEEEVFEEPTYMTEVLGKEAHSFLARQRHDQPFFLYVAFGAPHYPMMAPQRYLGRFPTSVERDRRTHLAMVAAVDDVLGGLLDQLREVGMEQDTVVFFQSDNGATREERASRVGGPATGGSNGPFRGYKLGVFDGGLRVPGLLRAPGVTPPGQVCDLPVMSMDVIATLAGLADVPASAEMDGRDVRPLLRGDSRPHEAFFWNHETQRAVRVGDWKLILNPPKFPGETPPNGPWLSNLEADPGERMNLADSEPERVAHMTEALRAWEVSVGLRK